MVKVTPVDDAKRNYVAGAAGAGTKYSAAVSRVTDWQDKASSDAAESLYAAKIAEATAVKRRQKSIERVSNEEWKKAAMDKGATRISSGMTASQDKWAREWSPFKGALEGTNIPDRSADPMSNIDNRVKPIVAALVAKKKEIKG